MTETEAALAKATYEKLVGSNQLFLLGQIEAILAVAGMSDSEINGAIHSARVVIPSQEARKKVASYTPDDAIRLYFANVLLIELKDKKRRKAQSENVTFRWSEVDTRRIPSMLRSKKDELVFKNEVGQALVKKMVELAGF